MAAAVCNICGNTITYPVDQVSVLADHFCADHPQHKVGYFSVEAPSKMDASCSPNKAKTNGNNKPSKNRIGPCDPCSCEVLECGRNYKTTVESWSQSPNQMQCPQCGVYAPPLIRRQRNKIAKSSIGAMCLLGCWPLCFLPFLLGGSNILNLYCKSCGAFIATYDRHLGRLDSDKMAKVDIPKLCCN